MIEFHTVLLFVGIYFMGFIVTGWFSVRFIDSYTFFYKQKVFWALVLWPIGIFWLYKWREKEE